MGIEMTLKFEYLLQGISIEQPCGVDCSFSNDFHAIKKAKTWDDPLLDQGDWIAEPKQADWQFVNDKIIELLCEKTKDIRLYTWLIQAWSHLYGFEGIARGLELSQQIAQFPILMKQIPLVSSAPFYSLSTYEALLHQRNMQLKQQDYSSENDPVQDLEYFEQLLLNTDKSILSRNNQYLLEIQTEWQKLKTTLDQLLGLDAPSFAATDSQLEAIFTSIKRIYKIETFAQPSEIILDQVNSPQPHTSEAVVMNISHVNSNLQKFQPHAQNHLANRQQAMQLLQEIAQYFQINEPHSPVSYMLQKTIKWSQLPLHEWLAQVIKNENPVEHVHELLGVHTNNESKNEW